MLLLNSKGNKLSGNLWRNSDSGLNNSLNCSNGAILTELRTDELQSFVGPTRALLNYFKPIKQGNTV
jgi:hypothetical protein